MSRDVSLTFKQAVFGQETDEVFLVLVTLDHDDLPQPIRFSSDAVNTVSRGDTYLAFPFMLQLPLDAPDQPPIARFIIDNIDRQMVASLRSITTPATVTLEIVRAGAPDTVEAIFPDFEMRDVQYNSLTIQGNLTYENFLREPYPQHLFTPGWFPGAF